MLAPWLKPILLEIISPTESTFIPGILITESVFITNESLHAIKNKRMVKEGCCEVKLGMQKLRIVLNGFSLKLCC